MKPLLSCFKKLLFTTLSLSVLIITSCESNSDETEESPKGSIYSVTGFVQKGPYLNGTTITISELDNQLRQTGTTYTTQIVDNKGTFNLDEFELVSPFVLLQANGFFFNETWNQSSNAQLTLFALADLTDQSSVNVNVLTNLEKSRVEYLVSEGLNFAEAKAQALSEILKIFNLGEEVQSSSEALDISSSGDEDAILLAISVILQGHLEVADLSELLANISTDIREDGVLDSESLKVTLVDNAKRAINSKVRANLLNRYENLGEVIDIPNFESHLTAFIDSANIELPGVINYPETGKHGINILNGLSKTSYKAGTYSMAIDLDAGDTVRVRIQGTNWYYPASQSASDTGWERSEWNEQDTSRTFWTVVSPGTADFRIDFQYLQDSAWTNDIRIIVDEFSFYSHNFYAWTKDITITP